VNNLSQVVIEIDDENVNKIKALAGYHDGDPIRYKASGGRWSPKRRVWTFPKTMDTCRALRRHFKDRLVIGPNLAQWAWIEREREDRIRAIATSTSAQLHRVPVHSPALAEAMGNRTYQQVAARFIAEVKNCLIADQPGLGKTLEAVAGLMEAELWHGPILVAAPLTSLHTVWQRELERFAPDALVTIAVATKGDNQAARAALIEQWHGWLTADHEEKIPHVLVVNPEMLRAVKVGENVLDNGDIEPIYGERFPLLNSVEWNAVILDESHRYLSGVRSQADLSLMGKALVGLKMRPGGLRMALSGTPMRGKPRNLWGTLHWLRPDIYTSFWKWADRYLVVTDGAYGKKVGDINPGVEDELYKSLDGIMLRRTKAEVVKELPPKQYVDLVCDMPTVQRKQYESMARQSYAELGDERITAMGVLAIMTRLKQMATCTWAPTPDGKPVAYMHPKTSGKTAQIEQMLIERGIAGDDREGEDKIVIASQFTEVINGLAGFLSSINVEYMTITGEVKESDRMRVTQTFQSQGGPRVLLMNTRAGGVSITLDAYCSELVVIDETWVPDDQEQLEDRIHRVSRIHQVTIFRMSSAETIDDHIRQITEDKEIIQKTLLDGRRGVEFAKLLSKP
jgi:SNF2 family DNA or RNA helicase